MRGAVLLDRPRHEDPGEGLRNGLYMATWDDVLAAVRDRLLLPPNARGERRPVIAGGAFSSSGLYTATWMDIVDASQAAIDLSLTSHKWAMYTNTLTPNFADTGDTAYSSTNEVSGTGYTAGGRTIAAGGGSPTVTDAGHVGLLTYDQNDMVWPSPTSVTARGAILYADALTTPVADALIVALTFGADFTSTAGTFTIQFASGGVFTIDLTP